MSSGPSASISAFETNTNAPNISYLDGDGGVVGASAIIPVETIPLYVAGDVISVGNINGNLQDSYYGTTKSVGVGMPYGIEMHAGISYSKFMKRINIIDKIFDLIWEKTSDEQCTM